MPKTIKRISAAETLDVLDLYFELQNIHLVAEKLGLSLGSVMYRLAPLGVVTRPVGNSAKTSLEQVNDMDHIASVRRHLLSRVEWERQNPFAVRKSESVPALELLSTVVLYFQLHSTAKVAENMLLSRGAVLARLKALGIKLVPQGNIYARAQDFNDMKKIENLLKRLHDQAEVEMTQAQ